MFLSTRRKFLTATSSVLAGTLLAPNILRAQKVARVSNYRHTPEQLLPHQMTKMDLRALALQAIDAGKQAGSSYVDARIGETYSLFVNLGEGIAPNANMESSFTYGVRVLVDGTWAFAHGTAASVDAIARATQNAVRTARSYSRLVQKRVELASAPVVTGEWVTPITVDPFSVPLEDQAALLHAYQSAGSRVRHGSAGGVFWWTRETRVFASSEGSLTSQTFHRSESSIRASGSYGTGYVSLYLPNLFSASGGYEVVAIRGLPDQIKALTEDAVRLSKLPRRALDVGRYQVVLDGRSLGVVLGQTLAVALESDRVLGYEADASGTSFVSPTDVIHTSFTNPLLTIMGNRCMPSISAVKWDDEGVEPEEYPIVTEGVLVNYHTSRQSAAELGAIYGKSLKSNGCASAVEAGSPINVRMPHIAVSPNTATTSLEDLCKNVTRGLLVKGARGLSTDQALSSASMTSGMQLFEIERGKVVRRLEGNGLQFNTGPLFKSLIALGDNGTVSNSSFRLYKGQPWHGALHSATAPAGLFKEINVISTNIRI